MEPKLPAPNLGPEIPSVNYGQQVEVGPQPEINIERNAEQFEQRSEATPVAVNAAPVLPPPLTPTLPSPVVDDSVALAQQATDAPLVANDDDLIEKEWVDKAKKIITETKDDPYRREVEVGKLQADYLRKRYGRELGASQ